MYMIQVSIQGAKKFCSELTAKINDFENYETKIKNIFMTLYNTWNGDAKNSFTIKADEKMKLLRIYIDSVIKMRDFYNNTIIPELENLQQIANNLGIPFGISGCSVSSFKTVTLKSTKTLVSQRCNSLIYTLECEKSILKDIQRTLGTLRYTSLPIYDELSNTIYDIENSQDNYNAFKSRFDDYFKEVCNFNEKVNKFMGAYDVPEKYEQISYQNFQKEVQYRMKFYQNIPYKLKFYISLNDLKATDDGFVICTKPLADIINNMGIFDTDLSQANDNDVQSYYDDWYLYGVLDESQKTTYSFIKMREQENDYKQDFADLDDPGVTISFVEFDINLLNDLSSMEINANKINSLTDEITRVISSKKQGYSSVLQTYFSATKSDAPYLVANLYIDKIVSTSQDNKIILPTQMKNANNRVISALEDLNQKSGKTIYDPENNCLHVNDTTNLTTEERLSILTAYTSNVSLNSFAAEVEFHSDALVDLKKYIPIIGREWYERAIRADMAIGEEKESNTVGGFDEYYNLESDLVKSQKNEHGDQ